jgi:hypothetical protein
LVHAANRHRHDGAFGDGDTVDDLARRCGNGLGP